MIAGLDTTDHFTEQTIPMNKHSGEEKQPLSRKKAFSFIPFVFYLFLIWLFVFLKALKGRVHPKIKNTHLSSYLQCYLSICLLSNIMELHYNSLGCSKCNKIHLLMQDNPQFFTICKVKDILCPQIKFRWGLQPALPMLLQRCPQLQWQLLTVQRHLQKHYTDFISRHWATAMILSALRHKA